MRRHPRGIPLAEQAVDCRYCGKPIRACARTKSRGFIHASGDCKGWVHAIGGWHSCVRNGPVWVFAEPASISPDA